MRSWLEEKGWLQGDFVEPNDVLALKKHFTDIPQDEEIYLIVASQSCDVCAYIENEPFIEFSVARKVEKTDGNFEFNKNPRKLHLKVNDNSHTDAIHSISLELISHEKIKLRKEDIQKEYKEIEPCKYLKLSQNTIQQYVGWLASRYNRPALPTEFERRFNNQWNKSKRDKIVEKSNNFLLGVYVDIAPDKEIDTNETYRVSLLFLTTPRISDEDKNAIEELARKYQECLEAVNITVVGNEIKSETQVSIATFKAYRRFYLDYLSYKHNTETPVL